MVGMTAALAALQIQGMTAAASGQGSGSFLVGTVTSAAPGPLQVTIDGASTPVSAVVGQALAPMLATTWTGTAATNPVLGARVICQRIGAQVYVTDILSGGFEVRFESGNAVTSAFTTSTGWQVVGSVTFSAPFQQTPRTIIQDTTGHGGGVVEWGTTANSPSGFSIRALNPSGTALGAQTVVWQSMSTPPNG